MDLYAELQQATNEGQEGSSLGLDLNQQNSNGFIEAILKCCKTTDGDNPCHSVDYEGRYMLTGILENCYTPFTNAVGLSDRKMVIISGKAKNVTQLNIIRDDSTSSLPTLDQDRAVSESASPFTVHNRHTIPISTSMGQKASYVTKNEPFPTSSNTSLFLSDEGAMPVSLDEARYFCSLYSMYCYGNSIKDLPDIWVVCQGTPILSMGCCINDPNTLNVYQIVKGSDVTVPDTDSYSLSLDSAPFNDRTGIHRTRTCKRNHKIITARYNIGVSAIKDVQLANFDSVCMSVDFIWNGNSSAVFSPPSSTAEVVMGVSVTPGYLMSPVLGVFTEITTLVSLCDIAFGNETWAMKYGVENEESILESTATSLLSKVQSFLNDASIQMLRSVETATSSPTVELSPFKPREDLDFLGQLWMFLSQVTNLEDLIESLGAIFKAIILGKVYPFIHQSKSSTLATLFRQSLYCTSNDEREVIATKLQCLLTEEKALKCLVEIGIEKLQRDFVAFFSLGGLATMNDLEPYFKSSDLLQQCQSLCCLQYVLELAGVLSTFVSLPLSSLSFFVRDTLRYYRSVEAFKGFSPSPVFNIHFPSMSEECKELASLASSLKPVSWSATISDSTNSCYSSSQRRRMFCVEEPLLTHQDTEHYKPEEDDTSSKLYLYHVKHESIELY